MKQKTSDLILIIKPNYNTSPANWTQWIERKEWKEWKKKGYIRYKDFIEDAMLKNNKEELNG